MLHRSRFCPLFIILILLPLSLSAQPTLLPPAHPVYDFLDRMETLGLLDHPLLGSKPVPRERIASLLDEVYEKTSNMQGVIQAEAFRLSRVDREALEFFRWEFSMGGERRWHVIGNSHVVDTFRVRDPYIIKVFDQFETGTLRVSNSRWSRINNWMYERDWFTQAFYRNGLNFYSYESDDIDGYFDPRGSARIIQQEEGDPIVITAVGIRMRASLYRRLGILFDFLDTTERGRAPYSSRSQLYSDHVGYVGGLADEEAANYDLTEFDLAIGGKYWELHAAKLPLRWGPGRSGQLLLSDWPTSFHQAQLNLNLGSRLRLTYLFGSLKTNPESEILDTLYTAFGDLRTIEAQKYIAAHRLEWNPHRRWRFAFSEAVVFGERSPELAYLIPINFFHSAQHDLGDEDNSLMCFDASWIPHAGWKLYGQFLIDDMTIGKLGSDYYGNKLAWLGGLSWVQPLGLENFDLTLEMAQQRPFVYTQDAPINTYQHWTAPLGFRYGPNSEVLFADLRYGPHRRVLLEASWTHLRHGANSDSVNYGGDINRPHESGMSEDAKFLGGILEKSQEVEIGGSYEILENLHLWSKGRWKDFDGEDSWEVEVGFGLN
jgi:hypothetical protein